MSVKEVAGHEVNFDAETATTRILFKGQVTIKNLLAMAESLYSDPDYNPAWNALIDMGEASFELSFFDMIRYTNFIGKDSRRIRGATVLVSRSLLHFGVGRMYDGVAGDKLGRLRVERTSEAAEAWLVEFRNQASSD